jgi:uncharacterized 2Fe-2S/4Fe-4S cluster protein (DUF4445 family)
MASFTVDFEPIGRRGACPQDQTLLECARQLSVDIVSLCGGVSVCERCKVQVISGPVTPPTPDEESAFGPEEIAQGFRLACQATPLGDVKIHVPPESLTAPQRTQVEGLQVDVAPDPTVRGLDVRLGPPNLEHPIADDLALWQAIGEQHGLPAGRIDLAVAQALSPELRRHDWQVSAALRGDEIVAIGALATVWLGLAVDIGTTKIAGYLLDLETGRTLASKGMMNPQISYGEDVVSRIAAANRSSDEAAALQRLLVDGLNQLAADLCSEAGAALETVVDAVIVGNTAIHHLFLRLPVRQLGASPYVPTVRAALDVKARDLNLAISPGAYVHILPNVAGYVGADHVAMLLAARVTQAEQVTLAIDIGTNTEICLSAGGRLTSVSCASGPAFEGAHIQFGMRAAPGAIEHLRIEGERLEIQTIGGLPPVGICGSGLLDAVAELYRHGVLDRGGRMAPAGPAQPRVRGEGGSREFVIIPEESRDGQQPITLSQHDVRVLQLAKGAIRVGIQALVADAGLQESDIQQVIVAGAFGTFIDVASAMAIGMFPDLPLERYHQVGNAAGTGARLALISKAQRSEARRIAEMDGYIELAGVHNFNRKFAEATFLT